MLSAISAESLKLRRHRATWLLVWLFPIGVTVIMLIGIAIELLPGVGSPSAAPDTGKWIENAAAFWNAPPHGFTRYLICAIAAIVFGGEYGWNTWKLIVPHRSRTTLLAAKYVMCLVLLYLAFIAAALIMMAMTWLEDVVTGDAIPAGITLGALAHAHWAGFLASLAPVMLTIAYTSLAAILTRSTTAALVIGIAITTLEGIFGTFGPALSFYLPSVVEPLYRALPGYHLANLNSWIGGGEAREVLFPSGAVLASGWATSLAVVAAWIAGLVALTLARFNRQDIN